MSAVGPAFGKEKRAFEPLGTGKATGNYAAKNPQRVGLHRQPEEKAQGAGKVLRPEVGQIVARLRPQAEVDRRQGSRLAAGRSWTTAALVAGTRVAILRDCPSWPAYPVEIPFPCSTRRYTTSIATPRVSAASGMRTRIDRRLTLPADHPVRSWKSAGHRLKSFRPSCRRDTKPDRARRLVLGRRSYPYGRRPGRCRPLSSCRLSGCRSVAWRPRLDRARPQMQTVQQRLPGLQRARLVDRRGRLFRRQVRAARAEQQLNGRMRLRQGTRIARRKQVEPIRCNFAFLQREQHFLGVHTGHCALPLSQDPVAPARYLVHLRA